MENIIVENNDNNDNEENAQYLKKKEYIRAWKQLNKDKMREQAKRNYIKKLNDNPEYRNILNDRTKKRQQKQRDETEPKPRGRPRTVEPKEKKPNGRPRKYVIVNLNE